MGVLIVARLVQAAGGCAGLLLGRAIVRDTAESTDAVRRLALMSLMTMVGPGLAPLVGGLLAGSLGWRAIFYVLTALGVVNFCVSWRLLPETGKPSGNISARGVARDYRALLGSPRFLGFALGGGCATTAFYGFIAAAPFIFINELHRPLHEVGLYLGLLIVGVSIGNILASRLIGRFSIERLLMAAVMSIGAANLFTRNFWKAYVDTGVTPAGEAKVAKLVSLVVKVGALVIILVLPTKFALDLQLLGGVWILQTFPAVVFGLFFAWFRAPALLLGWAVGLGTGTWLAFADGVKPVHTFVLGGDSYAMYTGLFALVVNIVVASIAQVALANRGARQAPAVR